MRIATTSARAGGRGIAPVPGHRANDDLHDVVAARLRRVDQRYTNGRRAIIELLATVGHPVSIGEIAERLPELPRSSAYRNLVDLETAGLVRRIAAQDDFARFELAEDLTEHHHHFLCVNCGSVRDFTLPPNLEKSITKSIDELAESEGFQPNGHRLDVFGVCASCA
jgi:Fe2+ or Zn2+ uptake regulation protein